MAVPKRGIGELERDQRYAVGAVEARTVLEYRVDQLGADQPREVVVDDHPLVVPDGLAPRGLEDVRGGDAALAGQLDQPVVDLDHRHVQLRDDDVNVVARVADQRDSLGVSRHVVLLAAIVASEQQQRRVVAAVEERAADLARSVQALEVRPRAAEVDGARELGAGGQRRAIGGDVMGDELSEQGPAGGGLGRVLAALTTVTDAAGAPERKHRLVLARECRQLGEEPHVASCGSVDRRVHRPGGRQAMIATEATRVGPVDSPRHRSKISRPADSVETENGNATVA